MPRSGAELRAPSAARSRLPWIEVAPGAPYFATESGEAWTPIGQNDAISWVELKGLFGRRDLPGVARHLATSPTTASPACA